MAICFQESKMFLLLDPIILLTRLCTNNKMWTNTQSLFQSECNKEIKCNTPLAWITSFAKTQIKQKAKNWKKKKKIATLPAPSQAILTHLLALPLTAFWLNQDRLQYNPVRKGKSTLIRLRVFTWLKIKKVFPRKKRK